MLFDACITDQAADLCKWLSIKGSRAAQQSLHFAGCLVPEKELAAT